MTLYLISLSDGRRWCFICHADELAGKVLQKFQRTDYVIVRELEL